jgi:RNA-binding protein Musashi
MKDRDTSKPRGFGFISFDTEEAVEKVMINVKEHKLLDKWVECKKATPKISQSKPAPPPPPRQKAHSV